MIDFSRAADAPIVTSVAISSGVRDKEGVWTPEQAKALFGYTRKMGGTIAATEFMNEPTIPGPGNAPKGYDAAAFARDAKLFGAFSAEGIAEDGLPGPGGVGEGAEGLISSAFKIEYDQVRRHSEGHGPDLSMGFHITSTDRYRSVAAGK